MSYTEATRRIESNDLNSLFSKALSKMYDIIKLFPSEQECTNKKGKAGVIVERLMTLINKDVAKKLYTRFPAETPLCVLSDIFKIDNIEQRTNRTQAFYPGEKRNVRGRVPGRRFNQPPGSHSGRQENNALDASRVLYVKRGGWQDARQSPNIEINRSILEGLVQETTADTKIQRKKMLACSSEAGISVNTNLHTYFTSPIRRYIDVIVHRFVVAAFIEQSDEAPYGVDELREVLDHLNLIMFRIDKYEQEKQSLSRAIALLNRSATVYPAVQSFNESSMWLRFPTEIDFPPETRKIDYNLFGISTVPDVDKMRGKLTLEWKQRIYSYDTSLIPYAATNCIKLSNIAEREFSEIPEDKWKELLDQISSGEQDVQTVVDRFNDRYFQNLSNRSSTNERVLSSEQEAFVNFKQTFQMGGLIQVQLTADIVRGMAQPSLQLLCLGPDLDICIEHQSNPLKCFATQEAEVASREKYQSLEQYQELWQRLVVMDAASSAVAQSQGATIHGIQIVWSKDENGSIFGKFQIEKKFCNDKDIYFSPSGVDERDSAISIPEQNQNFTTDSLWPIFDSFRDEQKYKEVNDRDHDFLCVRYTGKTYADTCSADDRASVSWVGHCVSRGVLSIQETRAVYLRLHQTSSRFPERMLHSDFQQRCTIEWLPRSIPSL